MICCFSRASFQPDQLADLFGDVVTNIVPAQGRGACTCKMKGSVISFDFSLISLTMKANLTVYSLNNLHTGYVQLYGAGFCIYSQQVHTTLVLEG